MPVSYMLTRIWQWVADQGLSLAILLVIALLVPRIGRFAQRWINREIEESGDADESKTRLALVGVSIYIAQVIVFFVLLVFFLQVLGFSLAGAAIPATVASAAVGFGAQSIIADFLAGFFILTEKQFGVGDWVRFEGNGIEVEGTVIQVTMRATRIRTLRQETVIIPNSTARVCINSSNYWSRAVVIMPVPLLGSDNPQEAIDRSEAATRRALDRPDVAAELLGDLDVHPAVSVSPPATVGMPWTVDMRFMVQVRAGSQWLVERAIRTAILDEFWDEYGSATTTSGEVKDTVTTKAFTTAPLIDVPVSPTPHESRTDEASTPPPGFADAEGRDPAVVDRGLQGDEPDRVGGPPRHAQDPDAPLDPDDPDATSGPSTVFRSEESGSAWHRFASLGGRVRASTTYLFAALFLLLLLKGLTLETSEAWEGQDGVLAPPPRPTEETAPAEPSTPPETEVVPEPTWEPTPTPSPQPTPDTGQTPATPGTPAPGAPGVTEQPGPSPATPTAPAGTPTNTAPAPATPEGEITSPLN